MVMVKWDWPVLFHVCDAQSKRGTVRENIKEKNCDLRGCNYYLS